MLFDFNTAFINLARREFGVDMPSAGPLFPTRWDYMDDYLDSKQVSHLWDIICRKDGFFWANLRWYPWSEQLLALAFNAQKLYYITSRSGPRVQQQTEEALRLLAKRFGRTLTGAVIPVDKPEHKFAVVNALHLTHFIDDKRETVETALVSCSNTNIALWHQPWNDQAMLEPRLCNPADFGRWLGVI